MKTLVFLQSAPLIGPLGWVFAVMALALSGLLVRLWYSMGNKERVKMERELKEGNRLLVKYRTEILEIGQRNNELANENRDLKDIIGAQNKKIADVQQANELLRETEQKQSMLLSALTARCARNEKLIIKLYTDLGRDIDLKHIGGPDTPEAPGIGE